MVVYRRKTTGKPEKYDFFNTLVLRMEIDCYNNHQVHSTTKEIPAVRFEHAHSSGNTLFRPFVLPKPYSSPKDIFCLRTTRMLNGYRRISLSGFDYEIPHVPPREFVELHFTLINDDQVEVRAWYQRKMVHSFVIPSNYLRGVHF